jgi:hypothetical protein
MIIFELPLFVNFFCNLYKFESFGPKLNFDKSDQFTISKNLKDKFEIFSIQFAILKFFIGIDLNFETWEE